MRRRQFLTGAGQSAAAMLAAGVPVLHAKARTDSRLAADPFALGVASGYPRADGFTLWTRLAPLPLQAKGGMPSDIFEVRWEVASDAQFRKLIAHGLAYAEPDWAHSVHVDLFNLPANQRYFYRFILGDAKSPVGSTKTAPLPTERLASLKFGVASCAHYEQGYFSAYRAMAEADLDLIAHVGDYIYESAWGNNRVRYFNAPEPMTLDDYRNRHALYRTDVDLQRAHAACPWIMTWDDHEVDNDYAKDLSEEDDVRELFLARRLNAYQAYYEHMPLPRRMVPLGNWMRIYTRVNAGALANFMVLDDRQYRSDHPCPPKGRRGSNVVDVATCTERTHPDLSLLGRAQENWLNEQIARNQSRWCVLVQPTLLAPHDMDLSTGVSAQSDGWDGYPAARQRLVDALATQPNPIIVGGDLHAFVVADVHAQPTDLQSKIVASEFVGTSITSQAWPNEKLQKELPQNKHMHMLDSSSRGYLELTMTEESCTARMMRCADVTLRDSKSTAMASFVVREGKAGAKQVS
jgi:alkaline phosphatase D